MKILYVEDNDDNVYVVKNRLTRWGHTVLVAVDGRQGIEMALTERPDLILMDLSLPELDGWEATRRLKAAAETKAIPVIALSAHAMAGDREKALDAGCDDFDTKPIDFTRLRGKIDALAPRREA
ncbi:MAG TPA: response regulator [Methylomirabilota bacterium]|jgi:two-component system cell cycle response regulator DivK|nr:response regulator [Methylomirabilota bacterium]